MYRFEQPERVDRQTVKTTKVIIEKGEQIKGQWWREGRDEYGDKTYGECSMGTLL